MDTKFGHILCGGGQWRTTLTTWFFNELFFLKVTEISPLFFAQTGGNCSKLLIWMHCQYLLDTLIFVEALDSFLSIVDNQLVEQMRDN